MLLAEHAMVWSGADEPVHDQRLGMSVDLGHLGLVVLPIDDEVAVEEVRKCEQIDRVGDASGQLEFVVQIDRRHVVPPKSGERFSWSAASPSAASGPRKFSIS